MPEDDFLRDYHAYAAYLAAELATHVRRGMAAEAMIKLMRLITS